MSKHITLDIGGTSIKTAIVDEFIILHQSKIVTNITDGRESIVESIFSAIEVMLPYADNNSQILISSAGDIDPLEGKVIFATNNLPGYSGLELRKIIEEKFNRKVKVINDAFAGLLGELFYQKSKVNNELPSNAVMITLGTGLGGAVVLNNTLITGENFRGGRFGHLSFDINGRDCTCGNKGCFEQYVSATGMLRTAKEFGLNFSDCNDLCLEALKGNKNAVMAIDSFIKHLSYVLISLNNIFDVNTIIIGGGLVYLADFWLEKLKNEIPNIASKISLAVSGNNAGVLGAYSLAEENKYLNLINKH